MTREDESKSGEKRLSDDVHVLEAEVAQLNLELERTKQAIRRLRDEEDPAKGVYRHEEIFRAQQDKLRLDVEIQFRTNKINRIELGIEELEPSEGVKDGFLF
jgi:predicted RNase H-like nuclease (RuvC/YqgF family)